MRLISLLLLTLMSGSVMADPTLNNHPGDWNKLFSTELRVDQNLPGAQQRGHDMFLRHGNTWAGDSRNINWLDHDGNNNLSWHNSTFDWQLTREGTSTSFTVGDYTLNHTSETGTWEGLGLWFNINDRHNMFENAFIDLAITDWNGDALENQISYRAKQNTRTYFELFDDQHVALESVAGTVNFHWDLEHYFSGNESPASDFTVALKGLDYHAYQFSVPVNDTGNSNGGEQPPIVTDVDSPLNHAIISGMMLLMIGSILRFKRGRPVW